MRIVYPAAAAALLISVSAPAMAATSYATTSGIYQILSSGSTSTFINTGTLTISSTAVGTSTPTPSSTTGTNYSAWQSTIKYSTTSTGASGYGNYARATSTVVYNPTTDTYTVRDTGSLTTTSSFGPSNVVSSSGNFTLYSKNGGTETFRLLNKSAVALTYVDYGEWKRSSTANGTTNVNDTYLVFGQKTPGASVPRTGSATYSASLDGTYINNTGAYNVSGTGTFNANFASASLGYSASATGTPPSTGSAIDFGTMTGTGSISYTGASFKG